MVGLSSKFWDPMSGGGVSCAQGLVSLGPTALGSVRTKPCCSVCYLAPLLPYPGPTGDVVSVVLAASFAPPSFVLVLCGMPLWSMEDPQISSHEQQRCPQPRARLPALTHMQLAESNNNCLKNTLNPGNLCSMTQIELYITAL